MKLSELISIDASRVKGDPEIAGLALDSRDVRPGYVFAALPGAKMDGRDYIPAALKAGAAAILLPHNSAADCGNAVKLEVENPRQALAEMARIFYQPQPEFIAAVTGTNGKTSVAHFARQLWELLDMSAGSIGTLGVQSDALTTGGGLTSPDTVKLQKILQSLAISGVKNVVFEASSHGLEQYRIDGANVSAAAFTNLTRDHLDYHKSMSSYFAAKKRLFTHILSPDGAAVVNVDSQAGKEIATGILATGRRLIAVGRDPSADIQLVDRKSVGVQQKLELKAFGKEASLVFPLPGAFQVDNALLALGLCVASGAKCEDVLSQFQHLKGVPGRLEYVGETPAGGLIFIDYAHTPDGLSNLLSSLKEHRSNAIRIVFGCGGDRDAGKRPLMGGIAAQLADHIYITDDNPRSEDPAKIRSDILQNCSQAKEFDDREDAICAAMSDLKKGELLVISGKGHEEGQIVGDKVHPFSDSAVVKNCLSRLAKGGKA